MANSQSSLLYLPLANNSKRKKLSEEKKLSKNIDIYLVIWQTNWAK